MNWPEPAAHPAQPAVDAIRAETDFVPEAVVVLGSGLADSLVESMDVVLSLPFDRLPGFPSPTVPGHDGHLVLGHLGGARVAVFRGRIHLYEHHDMAWCSLPVRTARGLGAGTAVVTAAVGGVSREAAPGMPVIVRDHINLMGVNTLAGWRFPDGSPAFVDLSDVYDAGLADLALARAGSLGIDAAEGVYVAVPGPSFETPAEIAMLHAMGAAVVGMSMVPEAVAARAQGMRVLGLAWVANTAGAPVAHEEVLEAGRAASRGAGLLINAILARPT